MKQQSDMQIDLFAEIEREEKEESQFRAIEKMYNEWKALSEITRVPEGSDERANLASILNYGYCKLYWHAYHECPELPDTQYIWLNGNYENYWVLNERGAGEGEYIKTCPYCGAELSKGKGSANLYKAPEKYWLFYLHYDIPMRELGYQPEDDREKIRAVWG